jgi:hypothetical protein
MQTLTAEYLSEMHGKRNFSMAAVPPGYLTNNQGLEGNFKYVKAQMLQNKQRAMVHSVNLLFQKLRLHSMEQEKTRKFEFEIDFPKEAGEEYYQVSFALHAFAHICAMYAYVFTHAHFITHTFCFVLEGHRATAAHEENEEAGPGRYY